VLVLEIAFGKIYVAFLRDIQVAATKSIGELWFSIGSDFLLHDHLENFETAHLN